MRSENNNGASCLVVSNPYQFFFLLRTTRYLTTNFIILSAPCLSEEVSALVQHLRQGSARGPAGRPTARRTPHAGGLARHHSGCAAAALGPASRNPRKEEPPPRRPSCEHDGGINKRPRAPNVSDVLTLLGQV